MNKIDIENFTYQELRNMALLSVAMYETVEDSNIKNFKSIANNEYTKEELIEFLFDDKKKENVKWMMNF